MNRCIEKLNIDKTELENELTTRPKAKPIKVMREKLKTDGYEHWCKLQQRGIRVEVFSECSAYKRVILEKKGITNSEWMTTLKMNCNIVPVRSLSHVLGSCHAGGSFGQSKKRFIVFQVGDQTEE